MTYGTGVAPASTLKTYRCGPTAARASKRKDGLRGGHVFGIGGDGESVLEGQGGSFQEPASRIDRVQVQAQDSMRSDQCPDMGIN